MYSDEVYIYIVYYIWGRGGGILSLITINSVLLLHCLPLFDFDKRKVPNLQYQVKLTEAKYPYNVITIKHPIIPLGPYLIQNVLQISFSSIGFTSCLCFLLFIYNVFVLYMSCVRNRRSKETTATYTK